MASHSTLMVISIFGKSQFHLNAVTKDIQYAEAISLLKPHTKTILQKLNFTHPLNATVSLTGSLAKKGDPAVKVDFSTSKNSVKTPILDLNNCEFRGNFSNQIDQKILPDDSNSRVQLNTFTSSWGTVSLKGKNISITNFDKPVTQFEFFSECTFPQLDEALSSSVLCFVDGSAKLYIAYNGPLIADPSLLDQLNAKIQIQNGKVIYVPRNLTFSDCNGNIDLTGNNLAVNNLQCNLNTNHLEVNINGYNLNRISSQTPGKATLNCNVFSPLINLSDFITLFNTDSPTASKKKQMVLQEQPIQLIMLWRMAICLSILKRNNYRLTILKQAMRMPFYYLPIKIGKFRKLSCSLPMAVLILPQKCTRQIILRTR